PIPGAQSIPTALPPDYLTKSVDAARVSPEDEFYQMQADLNKAKQQQQAEENAHPASLGRKILSGIAAVPMSHVFGSTPYEAYQQMTSAPGREAAKPYTQE